jgi:hypothetical protein
VVFKEGSMSKVRYGKGVYGMMRYMANVAAGHYKLEWQGDVVEIKKHQDIGYYEWYVFVNGAFKHATKKLDAAMDWVANVWGAEEVDSQNLMNGAPIKVRRSARGGVCDPGSESYWSA